MVIEDLYVNDTITEVGWSLIQSLSKRVVITYYREYDIDDLTSLAIVDLANYIIKVNPLIQSGQFQVRNIEGLLFKRARNTVSNYLFNNRKVQPEDTEILNLRLSSKPHYDNLDYSFKNDDEARELSLKIWRTMYDGKRAR